MWHRIGCVGIGAMIGGVGLTALMAGDRWHPPGEVALWCAAGAVIGALCALWVIFETEADQTHK